MRFGGERACERARSILESFRPRPVAALAPRIVLTGFGPFPGVTRNATADLIRAVARVASIELEPCSFRARDFVVGRGMLRLPSGQDVHASLMVLPVVWEVAAGLVAKEARATRASLVVMSGVAAPVQPILVERIATTSRVRMADALAVRPRCGPSRVRELPVTLDTDRATVAARDALKRESARHPRLSDIAQGAQQRTARHENAYVCNATTFTALALARRAMRLLRSSAKPQGVEVARTFRPAQGFVHWPSGTHPEHAEPCARVLLEITSALTSRA